MLSGWAVASAGIEKIAVFPEDVFVGEVEYGHERANVGNKFPLISGARNSGFSFEAHVEKSKLKSEHVVRADIVLGNGTCQEVRVAVATVEASANTCAAHEPDIVLNIDQPQVANNGAAIRPVDGTLSINGWAVARDSVASIEFELDQRSIGKAYLGIRREDVAKAFPTYPDCLLSGFSFSVPPRALSQGPHEVAISVRTKSGQRKETKFQIEVTEIAGRP